MANGWNGWKCKGYTNGTYWIRRQKIGGGFQGSRIAILSNHGGTCISVRNREYHGKNFWVAISDYIEKSIESGNYERIVVEYYERGNVVFDWSINE